MTGRGEHPLVLAHSAVPADMLGQQGQEFLRDVDDALGAMLNACETTPSAFRL